MGDDAVRRQLRFSLVLQIVAAALLAGAAIIRWVAFGVDLLDAVLLLVAGLAVAAAIWTRRQLRALNGD